MKKLAGILIVCFFASVVFNMITVYKYKEIQKQLSTCSEDISPTYQYLNSLTIRNFEESVESKMDLVVYIGRPDCPDCNYFEPILRKVVNEYNLFSKISYLNVKNYRKNNTIETWENFKNKYNFSQTPACILIKNGDIISTIEWDNSLGLTEDRFVEWLSYNKIL